jgi:H+-translocating NAD(P) transhydrogenase subunit alpha
MADSTQQLLDQAKAAAEAARHLAEQTQSYSDHLASLAASASAHALGGGAIDPIVFRLAIFVMAVFVGYYVVWSVTPALHTPLMSVTNAISSVIVVGALLSVAVDSAGASSLAVWFGFVALTLASVNIFGGFLVTERMLAMYKKKG